MGARNRPLNELMNRYTRRSGPIALGLLITDIALRVDMGGCLQRIDPAQASVRAACRRQDIGPVLHRP